MSYSHATREWALEQMWVCRFGRESIAEAASVRPRTISTWFRQEIRKLPYGHKLPNEYERSMGIVLSGFYPQLQDEIASAFKVPLRTLLQWKLDNKSKRKNSDLIERTRQGVVLLEMLIDPQMNTEEVKQYILDRKRWPDPEWLYRITWRELDRNMYLNIKFQVMRKPAELLGEDLSAEINFLQYFDQILFIGPHINRYANIEAGFEVCRDPDFLKSRVVGRFKEGQLIHFLDQAGVSASLTQMRTLEIPKYYKKEFEIYIKRELESLTV